MDCLWLSVNSVDVKILGVENGDFLVLNVVCVIDIMVILFVIIDDK